MHGIEQKQCNIKRLEEIIRELRGGATAQDVWERFHEVVSQALPAEGDQIKKYLVSEGIPEDEVNRWSSTHFTS